MSYFYFEEDFNDKSKVTIRPNHAPLHLERTEGSFGIICARLMGLSYPNYLRLCRDRYGATIIGKNNYYPFVFFTKSEKANELLKILNARAKEVLKGVR